MIKKLSLLAFAAMTVSAVASVRAAPIGFETMAADALASGKPQLITNTGSYQVPGFSFTGATVFHESQTSRANGYCCSAPDPADPSHQGVGFIQSRAGTLLTSPVNSIITVALDNNSAGGDIESITFDAATDSTDLEFYAIDKDNNRTKFDYLPSTVAWAWVSQKLDFSAILDSAGKNAVINRIEFVNLGGANDAFALDNLDFTLAGAGTPVPEPASLGLVMLALGAAGAAARRRPS